MKKHQNRLRRIALCAALMLSGVPAGAQDMTELAPGRTPGWSFTPGVTIGGLFDSNVALAAVDPVSDRAQGDRLLVAQPFGQLDFVAKRTEISAGYRGNVRRYMEFSQLNGFDQGAHASLRRLVSKRVTLLVTDNYAKVPTTDELEVNGVPFSRTGARRNAFAGHLTARLTKFTDVSVGYENTWIKFDRSESLLTGGVLNAWTTRLNHQVRERVSAGVEYAVRFADMNEGTRQLTFHDAGVSAQIGMSQRTSATFAAGYSFLNDRSLAVTRTGPYVRAELTRETERASFGAAFERIFVPSFGFGGSSDSQQLRGFVRMPLNSNRLYVQGSASWRRTDPLVEIELPLDTTLLRSTLGYAATPYLRVEAFHAFTRQDTRIAGGKVNRQRLGVQVVISQPMRIQ